MATVYGLEILDLLEDEIPVEAIVVSRILTADGHEALSIRFTNGLTSWARIGMLTAALDRARVDTNSGWRPDDSDDDEVQ